MRHYRFLLAGFAAALSMTSPAHAAPRADQAKIETLLIKDDIRSVIELYPFLVDGDTPSRSRKEWAEQIFTPDAVLVSRSPQGAVLLTIEGREQILAKFGGGDKDPAFSNRHFLTNTTFDEVAPDRARTRTIAVSITAVTEAGATAARPRSTPTRTSMFVYHDTWVRSANGWRKSRSEIQFLN